MRKYLFKVMVVYDLKKMAMSVSPSPIYEKNKNLCTHVPTFILLYYYFL